MTAPHRLAELAVIEAARGVCRGDTSVTELWSTVHDLDSLKPIGAPRAARSATVTSQTAALWARAWPTIGLVFNAIRLVPKTVDEIEQVLNLTHQTASARVHDLANAGWIKDSGKTRPTRSGRAAVVWEATAAAHAAWHTRPL